MQKHRLWRVIRMVFAVETIGESCCVSANECSFECKRTKVRVLSDISLCAIVKFLKIHGMMLVV